MEELPRGWLNVPASELFSFITSGSRGWAAHYADEGAAFIRVQNVRRGRIDLDFDDVQQVRPPAGTEGARTRLRAGDLAITITADLGRVGLVPDDVGEAYVNQHVALARPADVRLAPYLAWFFTSPDAQEQLGLLDRGATRSGLGLKDIGAVRVPLPPLAEQRRIVARIEALFARTRRARAELGRVAALAPRYRAQVLATTFDADPERGQGTTIADLATIVFDGPFGSNLKSDDYSATGVRVVRLENIGHLRFIAEKETFIPEPKAESLARHTLRPGDVLFSSFVDREVRVCVLPDDLPTAAINKADCFCVRVGDACLPEFLAYRLSTPATYEHMRETVHGATRPRISLSQLKQYRVDLPTVDEQRATLKAIASSRASADKTEAEATRALVLLDRLDAALLARAFRGELVPQDPADEPARLPHPLAAIARPRRRATPPA